MSKSQIRGTAWSVTINNPVASDEENIALARQKGWKVEGQKEVGENGTLHYQLLVKTPQVRWRAVKDMFPRGHTDLARNVAALEQYVHKEETRVGQLPTQSEFYPSMSKTYTMWYDWAEESPKYRKGQWASLTPEGFLEAFDSFVQDKICDGYYLETMAVNPQVRAAIKKFGFSILVRETNKLKTDSIDRQTDRQTAENKVEVNGINGQEVCSSSSRSSSPSCSSVCSVTESADV